MKKDLEPIERRELLTEDVDTVATRFHAEWTGERPPEHNRLDVEKPPESHLPIKHRVILAVCDDIEFDKRLRLAALHRGQIVIRVDSLDAALRTMHTDCCGLALLDLDLAGKSAWEAADGLLQDPKCPPVVLLTGTTQRFDLKMAVHAGSILEKSTSVERILDFVNDVLAAPHSVQAERNATQRVILRWLSPYRWPVARSAVHRFWGLNE